MNGTWISSSEAARILGCPVKTVNRLAERGRLTVRRLPEMRPRYKADEVERLARESTRPATATL